ncbi:hypothetical protein ABTL67_19530, partial [Acinetobacter baumannii]
ERNRGWLREISVQTTLARPLCPNAPPKIQSRPAADLAWRHQYCAQTRGCVRFTEVLWWRGP